MTGKIMRQTHIKSIAVIGYVLLVSLAVFGIIWIYKELVNYSENGKLVEPRKELVIITNTLAVLYQAEGTVGLLTLATDSLLKREYDSLMDTVFLQINHLKSVSIEPELLVHIDSLDILLLQKKKNTEELVHLMNQFEKETIKEIRRTTVLSAKDLEKLNTILENRKTEFIEDTTIIIAEKKGFFRRVQDVFNARHPDTLRQFSSRSHTNTEAIDIPSITDTIVDFIREINRDNQKKNAQLTIQVVRRQNELYRMNEKTISQINRITDKIEWYEQNNRLNLALEREATLKRISGIVSLIAYAALVIAIIFMSWVTCSISASQRLQKEIEKAKKKVENLLISREQLLLAITHDIKAPISSIIGYLELMKKSKLSGKDTYCIENMQQSSVHILNLVKDLLDFYSLDHDQQKINPQPFSPFLLVSNIFESFIPEADRKKIHFGMKMDIPADTNYISDPYRIRQVLNNLLSNAIKYTPENGSVTLRASLEENKDKTVMVLSVEDTGPGIRQEDKEKIFEEFRRLEYTGVGIEGLGLGLNISNKLSQLLGGAIEINSVFGKGSVFTVHIPLQGNNNEKTETDPPEKENTKSAQSLDKNIKVLFIDDDIVQLNLLSELMKREGLHPALCSNPLEALQLIQEESFDIIFSDIQMAGMNGFELVERIRSFAFNSGSTVPIIGLSAHSNIPEDKFREAGFSGFLSKPFTPAQLFEVIRLQTSHVCESKVSFSPDERGFMALTQFAGNDADAAKSIITSFITENKKNLEALQTAFEKEDRETIAAVCHKMIALMKMISAQKLVSLLQEYEKGSQSNENKLSLLTLIEEKIKEAETFLKES
jgi:signal transduction histidine kinase/DNA-binding response OmpR family regulator